MTYAVVGVPLESLLAFAGVVPDRVDAEGVGAAGGVAQALVDV